MATLSLNIRGPAGAKGPTGDQGPTGGAGSTGAQGDPGATGAAGPTVVSANSGNQAKVGTDSKLWTPGGLTIPLADSTKNGLLTQVSGLTTDYVTGQNACADLGTVIKPTIWSGRQSPNAIGNPNFEVTQRNIGAVVTAANQFVEDRWYNSNPTNLGYSVQVVTASLPVVIPNTNLTISSKYLRFTITTSKASLVPNDLAGVWQYVEGPMLRPLLGGAHSIQVLVRSSVAPVKFGLFIKNSDTTPIWALNVLFTYTGPANSWQILQFPNLANWTSNISWTTTPGSLGYITGITLGGSSNWIGTALNTWTNGNYVGAIGQDNFMANPVNSAFDVAFVQHEPGLVCTSLIDVPFHQNLRQCQRYYSKSFGYGLKPGVVGNINAGLKQIGTWISGTTVRMDSDYPVPMAKKPTITMWGFNSTSSNVIYIDSIGANVSGTISNDTRGLQNVNLASTPTGSQGAPALGSFTADTGW